MQPNRRSFLLGGRLFGGQWSRFLHRLSRITHGKVDDVTEGRGAASAALLVPARREDVYHARALCTEMGVQMGAWGSAAVASGPVLWVDPSRLRLFERLPSGGWRAEPGVAVADLLAEGLLWPELSQADHTRPVMAWLNQMQGATLQRCLHPGSGLEAAQVLLFDGQSDRLGRFGASTQREPLGLALRDIVSELFRYAQRPQVQAWREQPPWPARYRLDVLWQAEPNLARLLAGSQGTLAWVEWLEWLPASSPAPEAAELTEAAAPAPPGQAALALWLDEQVKNSFDPQAVLVQLRAP